MKDQGIIRTFFYGKRNENNQLGTGTLYITVKRTEFVSDRTPYIVLRGGLCNIIFRELGQKSKIYNNIFVRHDGNKLLTQTFI